MEPAQFYGSSACHLFRPLNMAYLDLVTMQHGLLGVRKCQLGSIHMSGQSKGTSAETLQLHNSHSYCATLPRMIEQ